ncbi:phage tail tape measure protein [Wohlfahrtiimonas chitiniclastica]|uniref:phage tail tape measure protein n=1 Tax=Wohlfahrtiimonas chitiniclastica TaxID=400946 RepID=UPI001BCD14F4|nr:phage tail tape measure protein [Wohlfahrtiimonas chitiniclastica]MBS7822148.1 phage tail tape measure protein [Wohlfahrtiimonas chitiniclastica]MBS7829940.1 phage tail tape measure protein [Wohlfahrtiimonas chitiniclastica]MBS7831907.1 phage tail tape measure protein [Wohlfahrtiimonas chitiniclastica]
MAELKMEVILQAFDHVTSVMRGIDGSIGKTKQNINDYKKRIRELNDRIPQVGPLSRAQQRDQQELDRTNRLIDRQKERLKRLYKTQAHRNAGKQMMGAGGMHIAAATAMGYGVSRFMDDGMNFDTTMGRVQALTRLQKDDPMLAALRANAKELGASTWADPTQVAQGQAFYAMAGFKPEEIIKSMAGTLDLAKAGDVDISRAADIGSNILSAFGLSADEMDRVGDILVGTFTRTNTDLEMLGETMKYVGPIAKGLGVSLEETSAIAGVLGNIGIQGSQSGTAMRAIFSRLAAGPSMAKKELAKLGIKTNDKKGNLRTPVDLLREVLQKTAKMGNAQRMGILKSIAGEEAAAAFSALIEKGNLEDLNRIIDELKNNHGESKQLAKVMADNLSGDMQQLNSAWTDFKISIFEVNNKGLRNTFKWLTKIMVNIGDFAKSNPEIISNLSYIAAGVMGITASLGLAKLAWGAFQFAVLGNPIVAAIAGIGLVMYGVYKNWDSLVWFFTDGVFQIGKDLRNVYDWLGSWIGRIPIIGSKLQFVFDIGANTILGIGTAFRKLGEFMGAGVAFVVNAFRDWDSSFAVLKSSVAEFWNDMVKWAQPAIDRVMKILQPFFDAYYAIVGKKDTAMYDKLDIENKTGLTYGEFGTLSPEVQLKAIGGNAPLNDAARQEDYQRILQNRINGTGNRTQTNTFKINITAPSGDASAIAESVKRGIASVTNKNSAFLGDVT